MPFTPKPYVDGVTALDAATMTRIEAGIQTAQATAETASSGGASGVVQVDSFSGADDATKMSAALSYAGAQSNVPWLQLPSRTFNTGSSTFGMFTGAKIAGAGVAFGPKNLEISSGKGVIGKWQTSCGSGANSLLQATGTVYDWNVSGIAFQGASGSQIFRSTVNAYACGFQNLTFYGCFAAFGNSSEKFLGTQIVWDGHFTCLSFTGMQFNIGGSDMRFNWYVNADSPTSVAGNGTPIVQFDTLSKTDHPGYLYLTAENDWGGLRIKGSDACKINFFGGTFEGRSATSLATRPILDVQGGHNVFFSPQLSQVSDQSANANGVVTQSGGTIEMYSAHYTRGSAVAATFPMLYQTGGTARVYHPKSSNAGENIYLRWSNGTTDTVPLPSNGYTA